MFRVKFLRNFITSIIFSVLFSFSNGDVQSLKYAPYDFSTSKLNAQGNSAGNLISYLQNRNTYLRPDTFYNRDIYDYSYEYDSFLNRIKNFPQTVVSYYPFSLQNMEYSYPRIYNRLSPYAPSMMSRNYQPQTNIQTFQDQTAMYRDAEKVESPSNIQIIKRLVPIGYSTELVSPGENIVNEPSMDLGSLMFSQPVVPQMNLIPVQSNIMWNPFSGYDTDTLIKTLAFLEKSNSTTLNQEDMEVYRQKIEIVIRLLLNSAPKVAGEFFKCLVESKSMKEAINSSPQKTPKVVFESSTTKKN